MNANNSVTGATPLYSSLGSDPELAEIVAQFVEEMPQRVRALRENARRGNREELGRLAHQMKGAAGSYGFDAITQHAARLERAVLDGEPEMAVLAALSELLQLCQRMRSGSGDNA